MKKILVSSLILISQLAFAQQATVDVALRPAGSFKGKTSDVKGTVTQKGTAFEAQNIVVDLRNLKTGIELRDEHTKKHLQVDKHPEAVLVSAKGEGGNGEGVIRIKGIEKKISGSYKIEGTKLIAEFPLKLSEFEITGIKYMGVGVDDEVKVTVEVPVKK